MGLEAEKMVAAEEQCGPSKLCGWSGEHSEYGAEAGDSRDFSTMLRTLDFNVLVDKGEVAN